MKRYERLKRALDVHKIRVETQRSSELWTGARTEEERSRLSGPAMHVFLNPNDRDAINRLQIAAGNSKERSAKALPEALAAEHLPHHDVEVPKRAYGYYIEAKEKTKN